MFSPNDPAGMAAAFSRAINKHTNHSSRSITTLEKYSCGFEKDLHIPDIEKLSVDIYEERIREIEELFQKADILHLHTIITDESEIGPFKIKDFVKGKKVVRHVHGHPLVRSNPDKYRIECQKLKRKVLVSTPDLRLFFPESFWLPNIVDVNDPLYMPPDEKHEDFTVVQAITNIALKDTEVLIQAAIKADVKLDLIMNVSLRECLERKKKAHVCFDHLRGFYGLSSLESLSQGVPVIANLSDWVKVNIKEFAETEDLPWINCKNVEEISSVFQDRHFFNAIGKASRNFMVNHWSDKKVVDRLIKFYETL